MSRELDFIDFINAQADVNESTKHQERNTDDWSIRSALADLSSEEVENPIERDILLEYQDTLRQLKQKEQELYDTRELLRNIHAGNNENYLAVKKGLYETGSRLTSQIDTFDRKLIDLQNDPGLKPVIDREYGKWRQRVEQKYKEAIERYREKSAKTQRELMDRYQKSKQEAQQKREQEAQQLMQEMLRKEQARQQQKQEIIKETKTPPPIPKPIAVLSNEEPKRGTLIETIKGVLPSIPFSLLGLCEYYIIYGLSVLAIALVFWILSYIPIINMLVDWLFRIREDTPDMFAMCFAAFLAYLGTTATAEHIIKDTRKHALKLTGIYLVVLNIIFLIVNLVNSDAIFPNIIIGIVGVVMFYKNKDE